METVALISAPKYAEKQAHTIFQTCQQLLYCSFCLILEFTIGFADFSSACFRRDYFVIDHARRCTLMKLTDH